MLMIFEIKTMIIFIFQVYLSAKRLNLLRSNVSGCFAVSIHGTLLVLRCGCKFINCLLYIFALLNGNFFMRLERLDRRSWLLLVCSLAIYVNELPGNYYTDSCKPSSLLSLLTYCTFQF